MSGYYELPAERSNYVYFQRRAIKQTSAHFHSAPEFLFVEQGEVEVIVGGKKRLLRAGEGCFLDSFCIHGYELSPALCYILLGEKSFFNRAFSAFENRSPPQFFEFDDYALLDFLYARYMRGFKDARGRCATFEGIVSILFAAIAERTPFVDRNEDKQNDLVCKVLKYAQENLEADLSVNGIARVFSYSPEHLSRVLRKYLLENWGKYVNRLRVKKARELLKTNEKVSVLDIVYECGFDSPNTFYRAYKRVYGETPRKNKV